MTIFAPSTVSTFAFIYFPHRVPWAFSIIWSCSNGCINLTRSLNMNPLILDKSQYLFFPNILLLIFIYQINFFYPGMSLSVLTMILFSLCYSIGVHYGNYNKREMREKIIIIFNNYIQIHIIQKYSHTLDFKKL